MPEFGKWLPIETAPKDGERFLAFNSHGLVIEPYFYIEIVHWYQDDDYLGTCGWNDEDGEEAVNITHWMPLPEPPEAS